MNIDCIEEIKRKIDLLAYVEGQTGRRAEKLKGTTYRMNPCPICGHKDHFDIHTDTNSYNSYSGCCKGGSVIDFEMEYNRKDKAHAISDLKKYIGVEPARETNNRKKEEKPKDRLKENPVKAVRDYTPIIDDWHSKVSQTDYFYRRGLTERTINKYKLGYNPVGGEYGEAFKFLLPVTKNYVIYREEGTNNGRYRNSKGNAQLLNIDYIKDTSKKHIFITEGYIDSLSIEEIGYNSIALNSKENANALMEYIKNNLERAKEKIFILVPDNDEQGKKLIDKLTDDFKACNVALEVFKYNNEYKDVNEYLKSNKEELNDELSFYIHSLGKADTTKNYLYKFLEEIKEQRNKKIISTGFLGLNEKLGDGLINGLYILGAISSLGKTTFALQIADYIAQKGTDVLFFSLEMSRFEMLAKSLSRELYKVAGIKANGIGTRAILKGDIAGLTQEFKQAITNYDETSNRLSIVEGNFDTGVIEIRERVERYITLTGQKPVVFVDYLQILKSSGRLSDKQEIDKNVTELKRISRDFDIPVIVISSLNRQNYSAPISFESFKESGSIEYTADVIMGLQLAGIKELEQTEKNKIANREKVNKMKNENPRHVDLVILKNRNGQAYSSQEFWFYPVNNLFKEIRR